MKKTNRKIDAESGRAISSLVAESCYTHEELAELLEVSPRSVDYYCTGERRPSTARLVKLIKLCIANAKTVS